MNIRGYESKDAEALTNIFYETIHEIGLSEYTQAQVDEWAPLPIDYEHWQSRLDKLPPFVAEINGVVVGFITLRDNGHIEWTYTHKEYQGQGIASGLYQYLENAASNKGLKKLTVNASFFALPFFKKQGFSTVRKNNTEKNGQLLVNWSMEKAIAL